MPLSDTPEFRMVKDYAPPAMTQDRVMWFGRGMAGEGPMMLDEPTQVFRIGAYLFQTPITFDANGNFIVDGKSYTPAQVFNLVQLALNAENMLE